MDWKRESSSKVDSCTLLNISLSTWTSNPLVASVVVSGRAAGREKRIGLEQTHLYCTAVQCSAVHCTALHDPALHALHCTALHGPALHALNCTALPCTALHCMTLHCTHCTSLHCTARPFTTRTELHCTALQCSALHCTALHCTALYRNKPSVYKDLPGYIGAFWRMHLFAAQTRAKRIIIYW